MDIVILGIQGSGKGTQADIIAKNYGFTVFEMGNELRKKAEESSPLGQEIKNLISNGKLVETEKVMEILEHFLIDHNSPESIIFDGLPRNTEQYLHFNQTLKKFGREFLVIHLVIPEDKTIDRLIKRSRQDDKPDIIKQRFQIFYNETKPAIDEMGKQHSVLNINADQSIQKVANDIDQMLKKSL